MAGAGRREVRLAGAGREGVKRWGGSLWQQDTPVRRAAGGAQVGSLRGPGGGGGGRRKEEELQGLGGRIGRGSWAGRRVPRCPSHALSRGSGLVTGKGLWQEPQSGGAWAGRRGCILALGGAQAPKWGAEGQGADWEATQDNAGLTGMCPQGRWACWRLGGRLCPSSPPTPRSRVLGWMACLDGWQTGWGPSSYPAVFGCWLGVSNTAG